MKRRQFLKASVLAGGGAAAATATVISAESGPSAARNSFQLKWMTVVSGHYHQGLEWDYQTANCIELLKRCCEILQPHGLVMVLEPRNWWANHPGCFLHKTPQVYQICREEQHAHLCL